MWDDDIVVLARFPHARVRWIHVCTHSQGPHACTHRAVMLARSLHARARAHWIHARLCPCPMDPRMHTCTGPIHTRSHQVPTCARLQDPHAHSLAGYPRALTRGVPMHACTWPMHACRTGSPHVLAHRVPTCACSQGLHAHLLAGYPRVLTCRVPIHARTGPMHACSHWVLTRAHSHRVLMHARSQGPHAHVCVRWMHHVCIPQLYVLGGLHVVVVVCSSSSSTVL